MIRIKSLELKNFKRYEYAKLDFPSKGRFLIRGKNEAGKSSLFEAIVFALFGKPVYLNQRSVKDLINFSATKASVILTLEIDETELRIERKIERGKRDRHLCIVYKDGKLINEKKIEDINKRIVKEIGLDYETLLNTCFVAQKKLSVLEGKGREDRKAIISSLFNLDKLSELSNDAKKRAKEIEEELKYANIIREACNAKRSLPELEDEISKLRERKKEFEAIKLAKKIKGLEDELKKLNEEISDLLKEEENYKTKVEELKRYEQELSEIEKYFQLKNRLDDKEKNIEELKSNIAEWEKERIELPNLYQRLEEINSYIELHKKLKEVEDLEDKKAKLSEVIKEFRDLQSKFETIKEKASLEKEITDIENAINYKNLEEEVNKIKELEKYNSEIERISKDIKRQKVYTITFASLSALLLFLSTLYRIALIPLFVLLPLIFISIYRINSLGREKIKLETKREGLDKQLQEDKRKIEEEFNKLKEIIREDIIDYSINELLSLKGKKERELEEYENAINEINNRKQSLLSKLSQLDIKVSGEEINELVNELENKVKEIENNIDKYSNIIGINPPDTLETLIAEEAQIKEKIKNLENLSQNISENKKRIDSIKGEIENIKKDLDSILKNLSSTPTPEYKENIKRNIERLREEKVEEHYEEIKKELNMKRGEKQNQERSLNNLINDFKKSFQEKEWTELCNRELNENEEMEILEKEKNLNEEIIRLKSKLEEYEKITGKSKEDLNPDETEKEIERLERERKKMDYAGKLLDETQKKIIDAIFPRTSAYLQKILPKLTSDNYKMVKLDPEKFIIKIYRKETNEYYEKDILSGGTQDQFSLALRLAFALASLPEKGNAPGFIFLDEPLGSFDEDRASALLELLTTGELADHFDQIFIITHVLLNEDYNNYFERLIYIEEGKIKVLS